ncbi:MAG: M48 family metallopeptidase [Pseudomonadota bacterium]
MVAVSATFFDGESAQPYPVVVDLREEGLHLATVGGDVSAIWSYDDIRALPKEVRSAPLVVHPVTRPMARLTLSDKEFEVALRGRARSLGKSSTDWPAVAKVSGFTIAAVLGVLLMVFQFIPAIAERLAPLIPPEDEIALGRSTKEQLRGLLSVFGDGEIAVCSTPEGDRALEEMQATLITGLDLPYPVEVEVYAIAQPNAFALPGGQIVLFSGLLEMAETPEEVAGVFAHEIGHVINRDPTRNALRAAGSAGLLGLLFGDVTGGFAVAGMAEALLNASYSREAEAAADAFVYDRFAELGLPAAGFAAFFERIEAQVADSPSEGPDDRIMDLLRSHPRLSDRAEEARAADTVLGGSYTPILDDGAWAELQEICADRDTPDPE